MINKIIKLWVFVVILGVFIIMSMVFVDILNEVEFVSQVKLKFMVLGGEFKQVLQVVIK